MKSHYVEKSKPPNRRDYAEWQKIGYTGTCEQYREAAKTQFEFHLSGNLGPHCSDCLGVGELLCDYPVGKNKTCDRIMCGFHAHEIAPNIHYCDGHYEMWKQFRESGGVDEILKNVIAFPYTRAQA